MGAQFQVYSLRAPTWPTDMYASPVFLVYSICGIFVSSLCVHLCYGSWVELGGQLAEVSFLLPLLGLLRVELSSQAWPQGPSWQSHLVGQVCI